MAIPLLNGQSEKWNLVAATAGLALGPFRFPFWQRQCPRLCDYVSMKVSGRCDSVGRAAGGDFRWAFLRSWRGG